MGLRTEGKKVSLRVLSISGNQALDTATSTGRLMLSVIGAVGQAEREAMLERQREGIAKAKREGRYKGRVPTARRQAAEISRLKEEGVRPSEIASRLGIGRASVYRVLGTDGRGTGGGVSLRSTSAGFWLIRCAAVIGGQPGRHAITRMRIVGAIVARGVSVAIRRWIVSCRWRVVRGARVIGSRRVIVSRWWRIIEGRKG